MIYETHSDSPRLLCRDRHFPMMAHSEYLLVFPHQHNSDMVTVLSTDGPAAIRDKGILWTAVI